MTGIRLILILLFVLIQSVSAYSATYYVDASNGDDLNDGLSPATAWQSTMKVTTEVFSPGDVIRFKRGEVWNLAYGGYPSYVLDFNNESGAPGNYITIMDYGAGPAPIINALEDVSDGGWFDEGGNIWSKSGIVAPPPVGRCWLGSVESIEAASQSSIDGSTTLWYHDEVAGILYVYSAGIPDDVTIARLGSCVRFMNSSYMVIKNLTIVGGTTANIQLRNSCNSIRILNNTLLRSAGSGIRGSVDISSGYTINDVIVEGNVIDGELSLIDYSVSSKEGVNGDGVILLFACINWVVRGNIIQNFSHDLIHLYAWNQYDVGNHDNIVEDNTLLGGNSTYIRGFGISGTEGKCTNNIFRNNLIEDCNVRTQPNGNNNQVYGNTFRNTRETLATNKSNVSQGIGLEGWLSDHEYVCHDNQIRGNIFTGVFNEGILVNGPYPYNNIIEDNMVIDAGRGGYNPNIAVYISPDSGSGTNIIKGNLLYDQDTDKIINYQGFLYTVEEANADLPDFIDNRTSVPPVGHAGGPYEADEGSFVAVAATGSDPDDEELTYAWDLDNDGTFEETGQTVTFSAESLDGPSSQIIKVKVTDPGGLFGVDDTIVTIHNVVPTVGTIIGPTEPIRLSDLASVSAEFMDPGVNDTHQNDDELPYEIFWSWGDGTTSAGTVTEANGSGSVTGSHIYDAPGVYTVILTVTDDDGGSASSEEPFQYVVIYDPEGGFVTGGGWIYSDPGNYMPDPSLEGEANSGFVSKYKKGANTPSGKTQFNFRVANLNFHSTLYDWLVIAGPHAKYKGTGTINGDGDYGFMLTATDGDVNGGGGVDKFRIKIWDKVTDTIVYDNQVGDADDEEPTTELVGGSIVIHKAKKSPMMDESKSSPEDTRLLAAYPNPFNPDVWLPYQLDSDSRINIRIHDMSGRLVRTLDLGTKSAGFYTTKSKAAYWDGRNEAGEQIASGIYFYTIQAGEYTATRKMVVAQ